jgi:hypothetical protein
VEVKVREVWECWSYQQEDACAGRLLHIENQETVLVFTSSASLTILTKSSLLLPYLVTIVSAAVPPWTNPQAVYILPATSSSSSSRVVESRSEQFWQVIGMLPQC